MTIYLSLGANLGDRRAALQRAISSIGQIRGAKVERVSSIYETAPWGKTDQPPFLNLAAKVTVTLSPLEFLRHTQRIERELGRVRHEHWGARTIDIDLLFAPGFAADTAELRLPHPYLKERAFVLVPLAEIAAGELLDGRTIKEWLALCPDKEGAASCTKI